MHTLPEALKQESNTACTISSYVCTYLGMYICPGNCTYALQVLYIVDYIHMYPADHSSLYRVCLEIRSFDQVKD